MNDNNMDDQEDLESGSDLPPERGRGDGLTKGISWKWVGLSIPVVLSIQLIFGGIGMALGMPGLAAFLSILAYFFGGMLIGRLSPGVTIKEPAIGAAVLLVVLSAIQVAYVGVEAVAPNVGTLIVSVLLSMIIAFGVTYLGARTGERLPGAQRVEHRP